MRADFVENLRQGGGGLPFPRFPGEAGVQDGPRDVEWAAGWVAGNVIRVVDGESGADFFCAPCGEFAQGHGVFVTAGEVDGAGFFRATEIDLLEEERGNVSRMQAVADLESRAAEADVFQRTPGAPGVDPKGENALVGLAKLPRAGEDAAAIDPNGEAVGVAVFQREPLGAELRAAVETDWRRCGELLGDSVARPARTGCGGWQLKASRSFFHRQAGERGDRIHATCRE